MLPLFLVDAFADRPFAGNPAAVCPLPGPDWPADERMQALAAEMNQAETAFVVPRPDDGAWGLRWFTPLREVDLCGHATLAAAHVLWATGAAPEGQVRFATRSGRLTAVRRGDGIEMDFPAEPATGCLAPPGLLDALGATAARFVGRNRFDILVELGTGAEVRALAPQFWRLAAFPTRGVIVTARGDGVGPDFVSRFFAPAVGVDEDPVTGSAHCALAVYWAERLGKAEMTGYQASARGGMVRVAVAGDRVRLGGKAVTVVEGKLSDGIL